MTIVVLFVWLTSFYNTFACYLSLVSFVIFCQFNRLYIVEWDDEVGIMSSVLSYCRMFHGCPARFRSLDVHVTKP